MTEIRMTSCGRSREIYVLLVMKHWILKEQASNVELKFSAT